MILICVRQLTSVQQDLVGPFVATALYRFSAFWLRSKCSICSYQLNIWYDPHVGSTILNWFLDHGEVLGACSTFAADRPGIAVPPGLVHSPRGEILNKINHFLNFSKNLDNSYMIRLRRRLWKHSFMDISLSTHFKAWYNLIWWKCI